MADSNKVLSLLGLAKKAGKLSGGELMTEKCVKEGRSQLVIVAEDASNNTKKDFHDMCTFYEVPIIELGSKEELGKWTGTEMRASLSVNDPGFASSIVKKYDSFREMEE